MPCRCDDYGPVGDTEKDQLRDSVRHWKKTANEATRNLCSVLGLLEKKHPEIMKELEISVLEWHRRHEESDLKRKKEAMKRLDEKKRYVENKKRQEREKDEAELTRLQKKLGK
jgi:hypothetical protein